MSSREGEWTGTKRRSITSKESKGDRTRNGGDIHTKTAKIRDFSLFFFPLPYIPSSQSNPFLPSAQYSTYLTCSKMKQAGPSLFLTGLLFRLLTNKVCLKISLNYAVIWLDFPGLSSCPFYAGLCDISPQSKALL